MVDLHRYKINNRPSLGSQSTFLIVVMRTTIAAGLVVGLLVALASINHEMMDLRYQIEGLKQGNAQLRETNHLLTVQYNSLVTPAEIERAAKKLGLISSNSRNVLILEGTRPRNVERQVAQSQLDSRTLHD
jgi:hypothetical protein